MKLSPQLIFDEIKNITQMFSRRDGESVVGIDIGTSSIKAVQIAERKGVAVLETYGEIALGPYADASVGQSVIPPPEKVAEALSDLFREANITARVGGITVPLSASMISLITLPTKDKGDLEAMIPIEARKYIPVPVGEVTLDWFVIPESEAAFLSAAGKTRTPHATDVLLVAIHNAALTRFNSVVKGAGFSPRFYEIEPFSMARSAYEHSTKPTMIIDFGASGTRIYIIEFGIIDVSHTINRGAQDITRAIAQSETLSFVEAEKKKRSGGAGEGAGLSTLQFIFSEARRIYLAYQRKEGKVISEVVLVGGGSLLSGLKEKAQQDFDATVTMGKPFQRVSAPAFIEEVLAEVGPSFANSVGVALRALKG